MVYIGQTGRSYKKRIMEHGRCYIDESNHSAYANHSKKFGQNFNEDFEVLQSLRSTGNCRNILLNNQTEMKRSPLLNEFP